MISRSRVFYMYFLCQGYRSVTPLDATRVNRTICKMIYNFEKFENLSKVQQWCGPSNLFGEQTTEQKQHQVYRVLL